VVPLLGFGWRDVSNRSHQPAMVEPVDPFEGSELDGLEETPGSAPVNQLGLIEPIDRFRQGVVAGIADTPYRSLDARDRSLSVYLMEAY